MAWLQPCWGPGPSSGQLSPIYVHRPPQMTAWAHWSWTSGRTSPSSPIRPAFESEQPPAAATGRTQAAAITAGGFFFFFFFNFLFCLFGLCPHPSPPPPISSFSLSPLPNSPQRSLQPCLQGPVLPSPLLQTRTREPLLCLPRTRPLGSGRDSGF